MRLFQLYRNEDETGISGTGTVAEGVQFGNGACALMWMTEHRSIALYACMEDLEAIHGHNGKTIVKWIDQNGPA